MRSAIPKECDAKRCEQEQPIGLVARLQGTLSLAREHREQRSKEQAGLSHFQEQRSKEEAGL